MKNIQLIIIALCFLIGCQGVSDNLAADYDELVSLFNEFRVSETDLGRWYS